jgi:lipopolysaccharide export system protein LptA
MRRASKGVLGKMLATDRARPALAAAAIALFGLWSAHAAAQNTAKTTPQAGAFSGLKMSGKDPIQIESDKLEVREKENMAIFSGNVVVAQGTTVLKAGKLTVYYVPGSGVASTGSSAIDHLEVEDTVYVKSDDQIATGDKGSFDMKSEMLVLTGEKVVLTQGDNVLVGCKLTVDMKVNQANFEGCAKSGGRVSTLLSPKNAPQTPAPAPSPSE